MAVTVVTRVGNSGQISTSVAFDRATKFHVNDGHLAVADSGDIYGSFAPGSWLWAYTQDSAVVTVTNSTGTRVVVVD